ncbi:glycosyltransferase [Clostridium intestinale]|uniref:glycosyltransferase n=1 Tax=Clostridium intestinale TaxID=36845 RepID=UPI002DD6671E|nr:glycosyltransferase [Clostridium intestinale]WRY53846.1 glycosyltransferase [Clostridium intestinale]
MISLCMIVKNEEKNIGDCLNSVKDIVDEIIIVDTGSSDKTKEIASKFTKNIYDYRWQNDFGSARNYSLSKASNDWILVLDGDENIVGYDKESVLNFVKLSSIDCIGRIKTFNTFDRHGEVKTYIERVNRLFNKKYYKYEGIVHEQLVPINNLIGKMIPADIEVDHIGYTTEIINSTNKIKRNICLLKEILLKAPSDIYILYQLGKSYYMNGEYREAYNHFKEAIGLLDKDVFLLEYIEDLIESYGYCLINLGKYEEALYIEKYEKYYRNEVDFIFLKALIYMNNSRFQESAEIFLKCLDMKDGKLLGTNSYLALYNIGVIFECLGFYKEALEYYYLCKNYTKAVERIKIIEKS